MNDSSSRPYLWMLAGSLSFSFMGVLTHDAGQRLDWQTVAVSRAFLPLVLVLILTKCSGVRLIFWGTKTLWMRSIAGSLSLVCTFYALTRLPVSDVFTLTNMFPIWVALLSWPMLGEKPTPAILACVLSGVLGVALIQQPHFAEGNFATFTALAASGFTAFAMLGLHRLKNVASEAIVVHFSAVALLFASAAYAFLPRRGSLTALMELHPALLVLGVGVTATFGQLCLTRAFATGAPAKVSVVCLTQIVFALLLDMLWLGRPIPPVQTLVGVVLVITPTAWLMTRVKKGRRPPHPAPSTLTELRAEPVASGR